MALATKLTFVMALALAASAPAWAQHEEHSGGDQHKEHGGRPEARGEPHAGPTRYQRVTEPAHWNERPATVDREHYEHNYRAARVYHIGEYHRPRGWVARRWAYGQILPRAYWAAPYIIAPPPRRP